MSAVARKRNVTILILALAVAAINFISMPAEFYAGDSYAIKVEAMHLVRDGKFGFTAQEAYKLGGFLDVRDQYFRFNETTGKYHNRWGLFDLAISAIPELVNIGKPEQYLDGKALKADKSSIFAHNIFNILLSLIFALFLYKSSLLFTRHNTLGVFLVFSILYASFTWNYMRAQSYEIVHLVLFTAFFYYYVLFLRSANNARSFATNRSFYLYNLLLAALCLSKSFYFYLYPILFLPICAKMISMSGQGVVRGMLLNRKNLCLVVLAGVVSMVVFLLSSYFYFGDIFFGYLKNHPHDGKIGFSYIFIADRLHDYFVSNNRSLFVHMPLLIAGLIGFPWCLRRHRYEALFLLGAFLFAVIYFSFCYTVGEWCYGPRFFLFLLPAMCLPSVYLVELFVKRRQVVALTALSMAVLLVSVISLRAQMDVNSRAFHLRYLLEGLLQQRVELPAEIRSYFEHANFAVIARDTNLLAQGKRTGYLAESFGKYFQEDKKDELYAQLQQFVTSTFPENYYFRQFPFSRQSGWH